MRPAEAVGKNERAPQCVQHQSSHGTMGNCDSDFSRGIGKINVVWVSGATPLGSPMLSGSGQQAMRSSGRSPTLNFLSLPANDKMDKRAVQRHIGRRICGCLEHAIHGWSLLPECKTTRATPHRRSLASRNSRSASCPRES